MATKEQVADAKEAYERLLKEYHNGNTTTVRLAPAPDEYRGDLSCVAFVDKVERKPLRGDGQPDRSEVYKGGALIGTLLSWYGNNGHGKLAAQEFQPAPGVEVIWED